MWALMAGFKTIYSFSLLETIVHGGRPPLLGKSYHMVGWGSGTAAPYFTIKTEGVPNMFAHNGDETTF